MLRGTRAVSRLPILQTVVGAILRAVLGRHIAIRFGSGAVLGILPAVIAIGITTVLIALIVSRLIGTTIVRIIGLQAILVSLIIRAVGLPVVEALLVHKVVRVVLTIGLVVILVLLRFIRSGELRRDERGDRDCKSKYPYCFSYIEFHLRLLIRAVENVRHDIGVGRLRTVGRCKGSIVLPI
jgi:hypothetical protein